MSAGVPNAPVNLLGADRCPMGWLGPRVPLTLADGSAQAMGVEMVDEEEEEDDARREEQAPRSGGRPKPRLVR